MHTLVGALGLIVWCAFHPNGAASVVRSKGPIGRAVPQDSPVTQDEDEEVEAPEEITPSALGALIELTASDDTLDETVRAEAIAQLTRARQWAVQADELTARRERWQADATAAPAKLADVRKRLDAPTPTPIVPTGEPEDLRAQFQEAERSREQAEARAAQLEAEITRRTTRRAQIPQERTAVSRRLEELNQDLVAATTTAPSVTSNASRRLLQAEQHTKQRELQALTDELLSYDATRELIRAQRDLAKLDAAQAGDAAARFKKALEEAEEDEARRAVRKAKAVLATVGSGPPEWVVAAKRNLALAQERDGIDDSLGAFTLRARAERKLADARGEADALERTLIWLRQGLERVGLTATTGRTLRQQQSEMPSIDELRSEIRERQSEVVRVFDRRFELDEWDRELTDLDRAVEARFSNGATAAQRRRLRELLIAQKELAAVLHEDYGDYVLSLEQLDNEQERMIQLIAELEELTDENLLWIRSHEPIGIHDLEALRSGGRAALERLKQQLRESVSHPSIAVVSTLWLLFAGVLLAARRRIRRRISELGVLAGPARTDRFRWTLTALPLTLLAAAIPPAACASAMTALGAFDLLAGYQLDFLTFFFGLMLARELNRPKALGDVHFRWDRRALALIRARASVGSWLCLPVGYVAIVLGAETTTESLVPHGRLPFIALLLTLAVLFQRTLSSLRHRAGANEASRSRLVVFFGIIGVGVPFALACVSALGWHFTATTLMHHVLLSALFGVGLLLGRAVVLRWSFLARRRLAIEMAERKKSQPTGMESDDTDTSSEVDLHQIGTQTGQMLRAFVSLGLVLGLWFIWSDVIPALKFLDRVEVWGSAETTTTIATSSPSTPTIPGLEAMSPSSQDVVSAPDTSSAVTLSGLVFVALLLTITVIAVRNIPGVLDIVLLTWIPLDKGTRYALVTLTRYVLTVVGLVMTFDALGVGWSSVQWIIAAMTVGLGFGLQEIFGNFVSGLIMLFERPVRVGDVVTVGDRTGSVSRIQMRATTIVDWDRRELVIPNKEFITGRLINWTLTDPVTRVVIPIGVEYGSSPRIVQAALLRAARTCPRVLRDPKPSAVFVDFLDSSLKFDLRFFVPHADHIPWARHEVNEAIQDELRKAGIPIPFPQRDIWFRSTPPAGTPAPD